MGFQKYLFLLLGLSLSVTGYSQKVKVKNSRIEVDGKPYAIIESESSPANIDFNLKYKANYSQFKLKNLKGETLAEIIPFRDTLNHFQNYEIRFINEGGPSLFYKAHNLIKSKFAEDLVKFEVISNDKINRYGLRKLYKHYKQGLVAFSYYVGGCGTGRRGTPFILNCTSNEISVHEVPYGKFEITALENDSTFKEIKYYNLDGAFIGSAKFNSVADTNLLEGLLNKYYLRSLKLTFTAMDGETIDFQINEYMVNEPVGIGTTYYGTEACGINNRLASQIIAISFTLRTLYFLKPAKHSL